MEPFLDEKEKIATLKRDGSLNVKDTKKQFFDELYALDDISDEEVTTKHFPQKTSPNPLNPVVSSSLTSAPPAVLTRTDSKRKRARQDIDPRTGRTVLKPRLTKAPTLSRAATVPEKSSTGKQPPSALKRTNTVPSLKQMHTDLSNLQLRIGAKKLRALPKSLVKNVKPQPIDQQICQGQVFFFVPNNDEDPVIRPIIHNVLMHGGKWAHVFCDDVTHVIVTVSKLAPEVVARSFPLKVLPHDVPILDIEWLYASWRNFYLQDTTAARFLYPGVKAHLAASRERAIEHGQGLVDKAVISHDTAALVNNSAKAQADEGHDMYAEAEAYVTKKIAVQDALGNDELHEAIAAARNGEDLSISFGDEESGTDDEVQTQPSVNTTQADPAVPRENIGFQCMQRHSGTSPQKTHNATAIEKLQAMATSYDRSNDQWRLKAFRQAISRLKKQDHLIGTKKEALTIGIGESIAEQIQDIMSTGRYKRLEYTQNDPRRQVLELFNGVYGCSNRTAERWIAQGHRTLQDLRTRAELTDNQRIGLEHYDDFQARIPRAEVAQHASIVEAAIKAADPNFQLIIGGSHRRGAKTSGDIDCILYIPNTSIERIRTLMLDTVIPSLSNQGFLKCALASGSSGADTSKWHGASCLPTSTIWRRIDLLFVPSDELGAALIYFTGNDLFNRSVRLLASRKQMRLNQRGLFGDVMRGHGRVKVTEGTLLESKSERKIFEILGVPFRGPTERNV